MSSIYLDNLATTRMCDESVDASLHWMRDDYGNAASRTHVHGWRAEAAVDEARADVAGLIGAERDAEIVFTSGATEASNMAIRGVVAQRPLRTHIVTTAIEHPSVLETCMDEAARGRADVTVVPVDRRGLVSPDAVADAVTPSTRLISIQAANNEIGVLQPLDALGEIARARGIVLHVDAAQAIGKVEFDVRTLAADLVSLSAHKLHGPQGVGALYVRAGGLAGDLPPLITGGGQEAGRRAGTLPVAMLAGFGAACRTAALRWRDDSERVGGLRDLLWDSLDRRVGGLTRNGEAGLPGCLNVTITDVAADALMAQAPQIAFSSASACSSRKGGGSHVLAAIGIDPDGQRRTVRFGLSRYTTETDVRIAADVLAEAVTRLRGGAAARRPLAS